MKLQNQSRKNQFIRDPYCFSHGNNTAHLHFKQAAWDYIIPCSKSMSLMSPRHCSCHTVLPHHSLYFRRGQTCLWLHQGVSTIQEVNPKHSIMISGGSNPPGDCPVLAQQLGLLLPGAAVMLRAKAVMIMNHR